ncbi:unnamed protein product [Clonostachys byssicola]|uniref:Heterokaryon incompatibility domain-containing protein n=1 Tax=Clonostachys byssicola TaxID=160290 RepID=A0A9N9UIF9_9HYPO|nr:unnamed protein product [Clonostachys byssicola]
MTKKMATPESDCETDVLCPRCRSIFSGQQILKSRSEQFASWPPPTHHPSVSSFEEAIRSGCVICNRLWWGLKRAGHGDLRVFDEEPGFSYWTLLRGRDEGIDLDIKVFYPSSLSYPYGGTEQWSFTLGQSVISSERYDGATTNVLADDGTSTSSKASWDRATSWLSQCRNHHETCKANKGCSSFLPTRLLDLSSDDKQIRLVAGEKRVCHEYATLSHHWGDSNIIRLRIDSMAQFQVGIDIDDLPQTFKDAVEVARKLDIFYLWIDALCIIQDDPSDWHTESALMGEVYSNGVLNIMATASQDSHQGLYRDRDPRELNHCSFKSSWTGIEEQQLTVVDYSLWRDLIMRAPLNERGWVVQERVLAPRTLHFAENQQAWECHTMEACEMYPDRLPMRLESFHSRVKLIDADAYKQWLTSRREYDPATHVGYDVWGRIIEIYSGTQLTKEADRLVAISGLAKRMRFILKDEYLAGLWARHLPYQLAWYIASQGRDGGKGRRVEKYRAPSWSWASIEGQVGMMTVERAANPESLIEIEEAKTTPFSSINDTAEVINGYIRLTGQPFTAEILGRDEEAGRSELKFQIDGKVVGGTVLSDEPIIAKHTSVVCLPVYRENREIGEFLCSLILKPAEGRPQGWYSRIGVMYWPDGASEGMEAWRDVSKQLEDPTLRDKFLGLENSFGTIILI